MYRTGGLRSVIWVALALFFSTAALAQSANPLVPAEFEVRAKLETREFRLRMLTVNDVAKEWPFKKVAFPGRSIDWDTCRNIPDEKR